MTLGSSVLIRCDGSSQVGFGHLVRCIALADELRRHGCHVAFAMRQGRTAFQMVEAQGFRLCVSPPITDSEQYGEWLSEICDVIVPQTLILDVRDDLPRSVVQSLKEQGMLIVTIDDPTDRRLDADLAFYPPVPQVHNISWVGFTGEVYSGWEWIVLRPEFASPPSQIPHCPPIVLVTMGGSDPAGLTLKTVAALDTLEDNFDVLLLLGPGFSQQENLKAFFSMTRHRCDIRRSVRDMPAILAHVDIAVATFGMTAYEVAAMGVPAIFLCLTDDHAESAQAFSNAGLGMTLGLGHTVSQTAIARSVAYLLHNKAVRQSMSEKARGVVRTDGVSNLARLIIERSHVVREQIRRVVWT